ncbi:tRNA (adenosine(37)-N6)-threonylcarbamoyltransferase complex transferase subunit TsaD [Eggerthellaceae bacterium zg-887]|uniref:tRNA (adenosine(37)-N6)-threonylcarbamoyltransferase complex transferase subunit TsaD n=1 Tax=Xiamenia xianingshaonis TaxID=2682776 RepID=UPI001409F1CA|nr:tRNA (adenosine(37)-N6)-threonylcarbamoyltransferase complex transferase subunit TsaD [Xiamenia xianingshaonis]NHM16433.1 tRNA (adenosine(37)-N6)-threonylcarbamoyltransferase complex transferase subunit TsaD [Xiamenia xianingshaonis]
MSFPTSTPAYVLAFDTANEVVVIGVGVLRPSDRTIETAASVEVAARRASNTTLLPTIDKTLRDLGISRESIACVAVGRGPGSFTGVRIAMATAKGVASALGVGLVGVSSLDAVAWGVWDAGMRGPLAVVADAMRKEVYPVRYAVSETGPQRLEADRVVKAQAAAAELSGEEGSQPETMLAGDGLCKYADLFAPCGQALDQAVWTPTGRGLLLALQALWQAGDADPFDAARHNPAFALPVYTRLSDAEENERVRLAKNDPKNLVTGVQDVAAAEEAAGLRRDRRTTMNDTAILNARADAAGLTYKPLDAAHAADVAALESQVMGSDAWNEALVADELPRPDRTWWAAYAEADGGRAEAEAESDSAAAPTSAGASAGRERLAGYAGGWVVDGQVQILKVGVDPAFRRRGIARELLSRVAADGRDLGASTCSLEVRAGNAGARAFYESLGMHALGTRPRYYSDGEDALIMEGPLPVASRDVAGMALDVNGARATQVLPHDQQLSSESGAGDPGFASHRPLILAIESSCDETAAAIVDGSGELAADVVASQIDFHARFGGVVPEIASRKHIEAVCGVCDECFDRAAQALSIPCLTWHDLDAVAVTYAPGLVGALVVGVAFAKGAAWAADKPFIGVHHLEGHLYANKIGAPDFAPPAVVSLVSGGNTLLVHMKDWGDYETLGATIDDAVGEAFDKVAKALGLGYPGGPAISREAARGDASAILFPRAMMHSGDLRFSLSGLKTAVVTHINNERAAGRELNVPDICASFQQAVVDVQVKKAETALRQTGARTFCLGGGVAANPVLREAYEKLCGRLGVRLIMPPLSACGDNAGMIALVALDRFADQRFYDLDADAHAHADLDEPY